MLCILPLSHLFDLRWKTFEKLVSILEFEFLSLTLIHGRHFKLMVITLING